MTKSAEWDGYGSYEAYINRGLGKVFNTDNAKIEHNEKERIVSPSDKSVNPKPRRRYKPKDVYDIVGSYPHHSGDNQWLVEMLLRLPLAKRESVMLRYGQVYNSARCAATKNSTESGRVRRVVNKWLLEYVEQ
jgi:hypothetical protein